MWEEWKERDGEGSNEITVGRMVSKMTRRRMAQERSEGKEGKTEGSVKGGLGERCEEE